MDNLYSNLSRLGFNVGYSGEHLLVELPGTLDAVKKVVLELQKALVNAELVLGFDEEKQLYVVYNQYTKEKSDFFDAKDAVLEITKEGTFGLITGVDVSSLSKVPSEKSTKVSTSKGYLVTYTLDTVDENDAPSVHQKLFKSMKKALKYIRKQKIDENGGTVSIEPYV